MKKRFSSLSAVLIIGLIWLTIESYEISRAPLAPESERVTESYFDGLDRRQFDAGGVLTQRVQIRSGSRPVGRPVRFQELYFAGKDDNNEQWEITSESGIYRIIADELKLTGGVIITMPGGSAVLSTPKLILELGNQRAYNAAPVKLVSDSSTTTARGLEIDLNDTTAKLLRDVETVYEG